MLTSVLLDMILLVENLKQGESVLFLWSIIGAPWEEECCTWLLGMVVDMWIGTRGFSHATAWIERCKSAQKKNLQKAKALRKKLNTSLDGEVYVCLPC